MPSPLLTVFYQWARLHLGHPIFLGYRIYKINGQEENKVLLLLRLANSIRPDAELAITFKSGTIARYYAHFMALSKAPDLPEPKDEVLGFDSQEDIIYWLQSGRMRSRWDKI